MIKIKNISIIMLAILLAFTGCKKHKAGGNIPEIAVTNSYIYSAVRDLCSDVNVICLMPPGMCPGHFDISPADVEQLRKCKLLLRFDFQGGIDGQMQRFKESGLQIGEIAAKPGMCIPDSYMATCEDVFRILYKHCPQKSDALQVRIKQINLRMTALTQQMRKSINVAGLADANVVCSVHQAQFAKSLGFNVVSTFLGSDMATPANLGQCLVAAEGKKILFVIANKQEGTELAKALARRLDAKMVVFNNFPDFTSGDESFDAMLQENIYQLTGGNK